jgi:hypothetical protein
LELDPFCFAGGEVHEGDYFWGGGLGHCDGVKAGDEGRGGAAGGPRKIGWEVEGSDLSSCSLEGVGEHWLER